jgi:predicted metal-binding membrane protein
VSFLVASLLLFAASVAVTVAWTMSMSAMGAMPMPGGWTMSMAWMRMPGQSWTFTVMSFLGMWIVMMLAMMLPSLIAMLQRYREGVASVAGTRLGWLTAVVGAGYFFVWTLIGAAAFPVGLALAEIEMQQPTVARVVPIAAGVVILIAGVFQFSTWKVHHLACCRYESAPAGPLRTGPSERTGPTTDGDAVAAWKHGIGLGVHCSLCCGNLIFILLVIGIMDIRAMAVVTAAITAERLAPSGECVARAIGVVCVAIGVVWLARR